MFTLNLLQSNSSISTGQQVNKKNTGLAAFPAFALGSQLGKLLLQRRKLLPQVFNDAFQPLHPGFQLLIGGHGIGAWETRMVVQTARANTHDYLSLRIGFATHLMCLGVPVVWCQ